MSSTSPPAEAQRYGRSQTPESPRPVHIAEPSNIPVLLNQMDPVFNDTATYNIPHNQTFSPLPDSSNEGMQQDVSADEHDAVQTFLREAENQAAAEPTMSNVHSATAFTDPVNDAALFPTIFASNASEDIPEQPPDEPSKDTTYAFESHPTSALESSSFVDSSAPNKITESPLLPTESDVGQDGASVEQIAAGESTELSGTTRVTSEEKDGVDYQSLLDNITQSTSTAPAADGLTIPTTSDAQPQSSPTPLLLIPGLPPKPPPQETPIDFPSYAFSNDAPQHVSENVSPSADVEMLPSSEQTVGTGAPLITPADASAVVQALNEQASSVNGLVPPLTAQSITTPAPGQTPSAQSMTSVDIQRSLDPAERPWSPKTQVSYDQFLEEERRYVTEGIWDKFPAGSRLFVGNLPSEKVTKRDLYHKFHKHGKLAQISIKQAYGFVQFLEATACLNALNAEQGVEIRGRKVHLEISKPQKNTRGGGGKSNQNQSRRRSRSPDRNNRRNYSDYRDEPGRRQSEYRNRRSPSPRAYRGRDDYRPGSRDGRPRSPIYPPGFVPPQAALDDEASLALPRRDPRTVPDVQILVLEPEVAQSFINWVEQGFRMKGLQASTIWLNPRLPLAAVVKRQIIEGVQAVIKLTRTAQNSSKIPLQVFDRTAGASNVNFNEYIDLDLNVAADIVSQARMKERAASSHTVDSQYRTPIYPPQPAYTQSTPYATSQPPVQYPPPLPAQFPPPPSQAYPYPPQAGVHRPTPQSHQSPVNQQQNLQQLLANLRQPSSQQGSGQAGNAIPGAMSTHGQAQNQYGTHGQPYGPYSPSTGYPAVTPQPGQPQSNVQNIMEQLARYHR